MGVRKVKVALVCLPVVLGAAGLALIVPREHQVGVRLLSVKSEALGKEVTVEFSRRDQAVWFSKAPRLQARADGAWQPVMSFPRFDEEIFARTGLARVVFLFPPQTEACRFSLDYGVGRRTYCKAYSSLCKYGLMQRLPKLSRTVLGLIPQNAGIRHFETELTLSS
jgi:hypothetical protein